MHEKGLSESGLPRTPVLKLFDNLYGYRAPGVRGPIRRFQSHGLAVGVFH